nr:putative quinol monooxygenase [uncultured Dysosmobacter sp.]
MLALNVTYHCKPGKREEFYKAICDLGVRANTNSEKGNLKYDYYFDLQDPNVLLLVETWETPEDQQIHCGTETFAKLQALKTEFCDTVTIDKFDY